MPPGRFPAVTGSTSQMRALRSVSQEMSPQATQPCKQVCASAHLGSRKHVISSLGSASYRVGPSRSCSLFPTSKQLCSFINSQFPKATQPDQTSGIRPRLGLGGGENPAGSSSGGSSSGSGRTDLGSGADVGCIPAVWPEASCLGSLSPCEKHSWWRFVK